MTNRDQRRPAAAEGGDAPAGRLLTLVEAAERLGMAPRALRRRCQLGQITYVATRPRTFREADLAAYIEALVTPAAAVAKPDPLADVEAKRTQQAKNLNRRRSRAA